MTGTRSCRSRTPDRSSRLTRLERLLEPFQRLDGDRTTQADGHYGLGLSIVRAIATAHGAALSVRAHPDGGLSVTARFTALD